MFPICLSQNNSETKHVSFIAMQPARVIEVCTRTIDRIESICEKKRRAYIEDEQTNLNNRWWFKLLMRRWPDKYKPYTFESTVTYIENWASKQIALTRYNSDFFPCDGWMSKEVVTKLLALAKEAERAGVQVMVTAEDWHCIK